LAKKLPKIKYKVTVDVVMSGDIEVEATSVKEAEKIAEKKTLFPDD